MLDERVRRLEGEVGEMRKDIGAMRADVAEMKGKVSMLPGYPGIAMIMAIIGGALLAIQRLFEMVGPAP